PPHESSSSVGIAFVFFDAIIVLGSGVLAYMLRTLLLGVTANNQLPKLRLLGFLTCYAILTVTCNAAQNLYAETALHSAQISRVRILKSFLLSSMLTIIVIFLAHERSVPRLAFGGTLLFSLAGLLAVRFVMQQRNLRRIELGLVTRHVLIVGAGPVGQAFQRYLQSHPYLAKTFCGYVDQTPCQDWLGVPADLARIVRDNFIDEVYFSPGSSRELVMKTASEARRERIAVKVIPDLYGGLAIGATMSYIGAVPVLELNRQPINASGLFFKRLMDLTITASILIVTSPIMILTAVAIKIDSRGPILYRGWRVGRKGRKFLCYKFRTMEDNADARKDSLRHMNERNGATFKIVNDPRITRVGRFLRKFSIDELPQVLNVLKGDMSLVGPRPHPLDDFERYNLQHLRRLDVTPGMTGLWQVTARCDPSFERNVLLDLEYIENWNILLDVKILLKTVPEVFRGSGH
ncbi:MAG TPA: sugar transferase, partial [Candidatus Angelobacter sp.]|nr:sugar transferase [Candidatus Angelobacter sp.]